MKTKVGNLLKMFVCKSVVVKELLLGVLICLIVATIISIFFHPKKVNSRTSDKEEVYVIEDVMVK